MTHGRAGRGARRRARPRWEQSVFFNRAWVPYDERGAWFAEADLGVSAHLDSLEARFAFRTRLLDHIAAGTPLVVTRGDVLAELVESRGWAASSLRATSRAGRRRSTALLDDDARVCGGAERRHRGAGRAHVERAAASRSPS